MKDINLILGVGKRMNNLVVWCADIGSVKNKKFGWCRGIEDKERSDFKEGTDIIEFCLGIAKDLSNGKKVAIGFECPLFVPVSDNPFALTNARQGENDRAWSAGAGCGALATGLTECVFILQEIRKATHEQIKPTFNWDDFRKGESNLLIWEAFISKSSKVLTHSGDAKVAIEAFMRYYPNLAEANAVTAVNPYNLVAAALLRTGITNDIGMLSESCIVIKG